MFIKLNRLIKGTSRKIILIVDNLRVHHCKPVKEWVGRHADKIKLEFLPSYSPEHKPDEYLNCDLKAALGKKPSPRSQADLETSLKGHMRMLSKSPKRAASYFTDGHISYAAAA